MKPAALLLGLACAVAGCSLAPDYKRPAVATPAAFSGASAPDGWKLAEPADSLDPDAWWTRFNDPLLDALEARVTVGNQNLAAAVARYDQSRALAGIARAATLPSLNLNASASRARTSENAPRRATRLVNDDLVLGISLGYEIDVWGRVRNAVAAGDARMQASAADLDTLRLGLRAELAANYFSLRGQEQTRRVLETSLAAFADALALAERRHAGGLVTELDVNQARLQVENTRATLAELRLHSAQLRNAIALLVGEPAPGFALADGALPAAPPPVQPGQPSALLERRPDVAAAERRVFASNADIGVARAAWFPTFSLGAALGSEATRGADWLLAPSRFWSLGPAAAFNLFDNGRIAGNVAAARAAHEEASANYRQTVLVAWREAEDSLAAIRELADEAAHQQAAEDAAQRAFEQARRQYEGGLVTFLPVANAQAALAQAQQAGIGLKVAELSARVQLIRALGGGWRAAE
ncbi:efflux transporter outer membrane subunit [Derxia lacustris]|uniref:efflux transporter outer membrane subunit n=1 Tax=Derxia lacustris TaxID=764842 RepID=UPI000A172A78|nr:efflux transporter outer membrane subunit [Derxia lacustris]